MENEALEGADLNALHPNKDSVQCPNCNAPLIKSSVEERKAKQEQLYRDANDTQASYMGISRQALEEIQNREPNR